MITDGYAPTEDGTPEPIQIRCSECSDIIDEFFIYTMELKNGKKAVFKMCTECFIASIENDIDRYEPTQELCEAWNEIMKVIANADRNLNETEYETIYKIINYGK
jgi:hypothetical protein